MKMILLTNDALEKGMTATTGINSHQLRLLKTDQLSGWKKRLIGRVVKEDVYNLFLSLKGITNKNKRIRIITNAGFNPSTMERTNQTMLPL